MMREFVEYPLHMGDGLYLIELVHHIYPRHDSQPCNIGGYGKVRAMFVDPSDEVGYSLVFCIQNIQVNTPPTKLLTQL